jgi:acetylornithine/N-succinyldiaminopimelate aminotransferase
VTREVRGDGLMLAMELTVPCKSVVRNALKAGFLVNCTQEKVLRFLPPLIIEPRHVDDLIAALRSIVAALAESVTKGVTA